MQTEKSCIDKELEDYNEYGSKIYKKYLDYEKIYEKLNEICIPESIRTGLHNYCLKTDTKRVLALAGGGAKGLVGNFCLVYLLDKLNLFQYFDEIWGVSAGAMIGSAYSCGIKPKAILELLVTVKNRDFFQFTLEGAIKGAGFLKTTKIYDFIQKVLCCEDINSCAKKFYALAVEFNGKSEQIHIFNSGSIADAVVASISVPDIFEPVIIDGKEYVDGGLIENTPSVSVLKHHRMMHDARKLAVLGTDFSKDHFQPYHRTLLKKATNLLGVYRHQLQLNQIEMVRAANDVEMGTISFDLEINMLEFNKMMFSIIPGFIQLLQKLKIMADSQNFNQTL